MLQTSHYSRTVSSGPSFALRVSIPSFSYPTLLRGGVQKFGPPSEAPYWHQSVEIFAL